MRVSRAITAALASDTVSQFARGFRRLAVAALVIAATAACAGDTTQAGEMKPDPNVWRLVVNHDYRTGDNPTLIHKYCGHTGAKTGPNVSNFAPGNVFWQNGALVLKFERRRNTSCTGVTRDYAGGGFELTTKPAKDLAVEMLVQGTDVAAVQPYFGLFARGVTPRCEWGVEDDFFEMSGSRPGRLGQTYHYWDSSCRHLMKQFFTDVPDIASTSHAYGVMRTNGGVKFYMDGAFKGYANANYATYPVNLSGGVLAKNTYGMPDDNHLPETILVRRIRVWQKIAA
jgi:hypothetical protein